MAEAFNSLFKAECVRNLVMRPSGGWKSVDDLETKVAEYIDWHNARRLHGELGHVPPVEYEDTYWATSNDANHGADTDAGNDAGTTDHYGEARVLSEIGSN